MEICVCTKTGKPANSCYVTVGLYMAVVLWHVLPARTWFKYVLHICTTLNCSYLCDSDANVSHRILWTIPDKKDWRKWVSEGKKCIEPCHFFPHKIRERIASYYYVLK